MANTGKQQSHTRIQLYHTGGGAEPERKHERSEASQRSVIVILAVILFFLFWCSLLFIVPYKQWGVSPAYIFETVKRRFEQLFEFLFHGSSPFGITVYQYLAVILVGAALAACGTIFQGSFRNMLAGPSTMGVMSGGTLGLLIYLLLFSSAHATVTVYTFDAAAYQARTFLDIYAQQLLTLLGCFAGVGLTMGVSLAAGRGRLSASTMIVCGSVFSSLTNSAMSLVQYYMILNDPTDERIELLRDLSMGTFDNITSWLTLVLMAAPIVVCLAVVLLLRHRLNVLALREDEAAAMGVNIYGLRIGMIVVGTVLTAVVVAFCGHIGFLGFMIPLVGRKFVGPNMEKLLPVSMLIGAILLVIVFDIASIAMLTSYLNLFTSSIGGIVLLVTLLKKGGSGRAAA